jgi:hypothetical protein
MQGKYFLHFRMNLIDIYTDSNIQKEGGKFRLSIDIQILIILLSTVFKRKMKSIKILSLFTMIAVLSGMSQPVSAVMNRARTSISENDYLVDLGPIFSETEQEITPHSGFDRPGDKNLKAHTHFKFMITAIGIDKLNTAIRSSPYTPIGLPPISGFGYETPASLACVYNLATPSPGCNPNIVTTPATGGSKVIAILVAYHYRFAKDDLTAFSTQFGLSLPTATNFQVV